MINQTTFIYQIANNTCYIQEPNWPLQELTIKGSTDYQGTVNGTWFQVDHLTNHWISFRRNRFNANKWEVFYKCVSNSKTKYYRRMFYGTEDILTFSFSEKDEWVKMANERAGFKLFSI